jgi:membrane-associated phospholipid phosphatase
MLAIVPAAGLTPYDADPLVDGLATGTLLGVVALLELGAKPALPRGMTCDLEAGAVRCDDSELNALDRTVVGNRSKTWRRVGDASVATALVLPVVGTAIDAWGGDSPSPGTDAAIDLLVITEAVAVSTFVTFVMKYAVRRPRPTQYTEGAFVDSPDHSMSFPSGHTAASAAAAAAYATTFALRHPDSAWRWVIAGVAVAATGFVGASRIAGGMHFYTDVLAGALLGGATGVLVPVLHERDARLAATVGPAPGGPVRSLMFAVRF